MVVEKKLCTTRMDCLHRTQTIEYSAIISTLVGKTTIVVLFWSLYLRFLSFLGLLALCFVLELKILKSSESANISHLSRIFSSKSPYLNLVHSSGQVRKHYHLYLATYQFVALGFELEWLRLYLQPLLFFSVQYLLVY